MLLQSWIISLLVFCCVDVHTTTLPAPVDEYINAICHVLHYAQSPQTFTYRPQSLNIQLRKYFTFIHN